MCIVTRSFSEVFHGCDNVLPTKDASWSLENACALLTQALNWKQPGNHLKFWERGRKMAWNGIKLYKTDKTVLTSCDCKTSPCCSEGPAARLWEPPGRQSVGRSDRKEENGIEKGHWTKKTRAKSQWGETLILNNFEAECGLRWSLSFTKPFVLWFFHIYSLDFPCVGAVNPLA